MLLAQTSDGIARVVRGELHLLDDAGRTLEDFILGGRLAELGGAKTRKEIAWDQATLASPVRRPGKIVIIGLNYRDHAAETGNPLPSFPRFHLIPGSAVAAGGSVVRLPRIAPDKVDYEGELAVVIGRTGRDIPEKSAWDFVAGATVADDLSARDIQAGENPALPMASPALAKGFDGFKPLGPALLTTDELRQHDGLGITTEVNGVVRQRSSTAELVFSIPQLLACVSSFLTLEAGDVVLTGTPGGTGMAEGRFLRAGDVVAVTVENIGTLTNTIAATEHTQTREAAQ
ncbi:MAG: putative fumarylacetoacetate hydrolase family [Amycolatopsis sp.]|uniref:fumarylacetoacetate hydrolase family protein n=1 Tax=Amycolatopsis sp. TaxID=37632 RepID=UPI00260D20B5|nr:fumarylacetoacetate hydrolase family protein [Amycolatopsis sp.]MCU1683967.1 putative fumarylacetoacetate hydrolase family [Amycolatopsis sp.]